MQAKVNTPPKISLLKDKFVIEDAVTGHHYRLQKSNEPHQLLKT